MLMKADLRIPAPSHIAPNRSGPLGVVPRPVDLEETIPLGQGMRPSAEILPMRCLRCQGPVEWGTAPVHVERNGYRLAWEAVPAWICRRCDLAYFEPREVETIQRALQAMRGKPKK
jgi:hypothetical protein